jgi:hypothetical protein
MSDDAFYYDAYAETDQVNVIDLHENGGMELTVARGVIGAPVRIYIRQGPHATVARLTDDEAGTVRWAIEEYTGLAERQRENGRAWRRRELGRWALLLAFALVLLGVLIAIGSDRLLIGASGTATIAIALEVIRWLRR